MHEVVDVRAPGAGSAAPAKAARRTGAAARPGQPVIHW